MWPGGIENAAERRRGDEKVWKRIVFVFRPCNPLKFHKTAKALFGKAWTKTA
jgi:hypothetical protein